MYQKENYKEVKLKGSAGSPGLAMGDAIFYNRENMSISFRKINESEVEEHLYQFKQAREKAKEELELLLNDELDDNADKLIRSQVEMINDPDLCKRIKTRIKKDHLPADYAIQQVFEEFLEIINQRDTKKFIESTVDISDVRDRLIQIVNDQQIDFEGATGRIVVAKELSPREVIELAEYNIKGIIMDHGGRTSHAAIIARAINIPAVVGVKKATKYVDQVRQVILDGKAGAIILNPGEKTRNQFREKLDKERNKFENQKEICIKPSITDDGKSFILRANIEFKEELANIKEFCAEGIGLLRTESIYLHRDRFGDQKKQEAFYTAILEGAGKHPVTIRLFDAGGDKFFNLGEKEHNPFLGWRGIRMLLDEKHLLRAQLKAILKVAAENPGRVRILVPMISCMEEVMQLKEIIKDEQGSLIENGIQADEQLQLGIMVEVPSVAVQAGKFARHVDFLSIGTNDLTQYTMAVDRGNELISHLYDQRYPAIWELIKMTAGAAQRNNVEISVCGELASDPVSACCLVGMGIYDLSMSPSSIPAVKTLLMQHSLSEMEQLSADVLECNTIEEVNELFKKWQSNKK